MKILYSNQEGFSEAFEALLGRGKMDIERVTTIVSDIIGAVKEEGDRAVVRDIERFDKWEVKEHFRIDGDEMKQAYEALDDALRSALQLAYDRIRAYHEKQLPKSWIDFESSGAMLGQKITPVDRAGLYIPGGKAAYPSSLLMNAIPAIVAGVEEIVVCTPTPEGEINHLLLAAMHLCGIKEAYRVGGATAIAMMAHGTESVKKVDVITGPGNIFVATAKKLLFGEVNIDMIAGPSEIGIIADDRARSDYLSIDMLSQAEHDEMASSLLITTSEHVATETLAQIESDLKRLPREEIARASIENRGAIIVVKDLDEAVALMNRIAPEHLELMIANPFDLLPKIKHAGAIFMGDYTPEAIGDYIAGPNHTLPTGGSAKFYSPLGVENFLKRSSLISMSETSLDEIGEACALLANVEGLDAHRKSVEIRLKKD